MFTGSTNAKAYQEKKNLSFCLFSGFFQKIKCSAFCQATFICVQYNSGLAFLFSDSDRYRKNNIFQTIGVRPSAGLSGSDRKANKTRHGAFFSLISAVSPPHQDIQNRCQKFEKGMPAVGVWMILRGKGWKKYFAYLSSFKIF